MMLMLSDRYACGSIVADPAVNRNTFASVVASTSCKARRDGLE
jgi:hypothetical protein